MRNDTTMCERESYRNGVAAAKARHDEKVARTKDTLANFVGWGKDKGAAEAKERMAKRKAKYQTWNGKPVVSGE